MALEKTSAELSHDASPQSQRNFYISAMTALLLIVILGFMRNLNTIHELQAKAKVDAKLK